MSRGRVACVAGIVFGLMIAATALSHPAPASPAPLQQVPGGQAPAPDPAKRPMADQPPPPVQFTPPTLELDELRPNQKVEREITITNLGQDAMWIRDARPDCGCTTVELARGRLMPGESTKMRITYRASSTIGEKRAEVRVAFLNHALTSYMIAASIELPVMPDPPYINALQQADGSRPLMGTFTLESKDDRPFHVLSVNGEAPPFVDYNPQRDDARTSYTLRWDFTAFDPETCVDSQGRRLPPFVVVETDHPEARVLDLEVRHLCARRQPIAPSDTWALQEKRLLVDHLNEGRYADFEVMAKWIPRRQEGDYINSVTTDSDQFSVELLGVDAIREGQIARIRVHAKPGHQGFIWGTMTVRSRGQVGSMIVTGSSRPAPAPATP